MDTIDGKLYVHWSDIHIMCMHLANLIIEEPFQYVGVLTVAKGGLVPTGIVMNYLCQHRRYKKLPIDIIHINTRHQDDGSKRHSIYSLPGFPPEARILVIDDVIDTGFTSMIIKEHHSRAKFASLFVKPAGQMYAEYAVQKVPQDQWIVFPWEPECMEALN